MPESPLFPSLDFEMQQVRNMGLQDPGNLPDYGIPETIANISELHSQIRLMKSANPLVQKYSGVRSTEDFLFPSIKDALSPRTRTSDAIPTPFDPTREQYDRYRDSKYYKNIGFLPGRDNEELYGRAQSGWGAIAAGISGSWKLLKFQFADQLKGWGRLVDGIFSGDLSKVYDDTDLETVNGELDKIMNENPVFLTEKDRNSVFTWANFANVVQQSGFTLGALTEIAAEELLLSAITAGTGGAAAPVQAARTAQLTGTINRALNRLLRIENVVLDADRTRKVVGNIAKYTPFTHGLQVLAKGAKADETAAQFAFRGFGGLYRDLREANAAFTEARAESSGTYADLKNSLLYDLYDSNRAVTQDDIDRIERTAKEASDANFWANSAIIGISNRIQFDNIFRGFKGASKYLADIGDVAEDKLGYFKRSVLPFTKGFVRTAKAEVFPKFFKYFKNNITEALQENLQSVSNNAVQSYYKANYNNPGSGILTDSIYEAISKEFTTEGAKTFLSGFLTGAITSPVSRGIPALYNRVSTTKAQREQRKNNIQKQLSALNGFFSKPEGRNAATQFSIAGAMGEAIKNNDIKGFLDLKDESVRSFVRTAIETGKVESLFDRLHSIARGLTKEEFQKAFGIEYADSNKDTPVQYIENLRRKTRQIQEVKEDLDFKFPNPFSPKETDSPETAIEAIRSHQLFEEAKWHIAYMKDAHLRTSQRQTSVLRDMQDEMKEVNYSAISNLLDVKRAKDEVKMLRKEAALTNDVRIKEMKQKKADILNALIPSLEKGNLDPRTFTEYVNLVQEEANRPGITQDIIDNNLTRVNDYLKLEDDKKKLFNNLNFLADPENFANFVSRHEQFAAEEDRMEKAVAAIDKEILEPIRKENPDVDVVINKEDGGTITVTPKEGVETTQDRIDAVKQKIEEKLAEKKEDPDKVITDRLADIYDKLSKTGEIDAQDRAFLDQENVKKIGENNADYRKIKAFLDRTPEETKEETKTQEDTTDEGTTVTDQDEDAYPHYEGSEKEIDIPIPKGAAKTVIQEVVDGRNQGKRNEKGDAILEGGYSMVRGEVTRMFKNNPHLLDAYEFVIVHDTRFFYEHVSEMTDEAKAQLDVFNENSPYSFFIKKGKHSDKPVIIIRDRKTKELAYFNPNNDGMIADSKTGVILALTFDYTKSGLNNKQISDFINSQPNQEYVIDFSNIDPISLGSYYENIGQLRDINQFFEDVRPDHGATIHISKGLKDEEWNPPVAPERTDLEMWNAENTRNGGAFIRIGNLNMIKLVPSRIDQIIIGKKQYSVDDLFSYAYTPEEAARVVKELRKIIYGGPFKPKNQDFEMIVVSSEPHKTEQGKVAIKLVRLVDTTPEIRDTRKKTFKDSQQATPTILAYMKREGRRINVLAEVHQDISVPLIEEGKLEFVTMNYMDFISTNLFTNKARNVRPDGTLSINPTNNFFIIPGLADLIKGNPVTNTKAQNVADNLTGKTQVEPKKEEPPAPKPDDVTKPPEDKKPPSARDLLDRLRRETGDMPEDPINPDDIIPKLKEGVAKALISNKELQFIRDRFGDHVLNHLAYAVNSDYWGYWKNSVITLYADARRGVGYHEAWHHFSQTFLTRDEKIRLYNEVMSEVPELRGADLKKVEEYLADKFMDYALNQESEQAPVRKNIFQKIWEFLKRLFKSSKIPNKSDLDKYFSDLYQGKLEAYRPTINNALWGRLNYGFVVNGVEIFDTKENAVLRGFFNVLLYRAFVSNEAEHNLKESNISMASLMGVRDNPTVRNPIIRKVYLAVRNQLLRYIDDNVHELDQNRATLSMLERLISNFNEFFSESMKRLQLPSNVEDIVEQEDEDLTDASQIKGEEGIQEEPTEKFSDLETGAEEAQFSDRILPFTDKGLLASVSKVIRNFVATIPKAQVAYNPDGTIANITEYKNSYGLPEPADSHRILAILGEELAGIFKDNEMLEKLNSNELLQRLPETAFIRRTLPGFGHGEDYSVQIIMSMMRDFNRVFVPVYSSVQLEDGRIIMVEKTKNTQNKIKRLWQDNFLGSGNTVVDTDKASTYLHPEYATRNWNLVPRAGTGEQTIQNRIEFLRGLGITISERTLKIRAFRDLISGDKFFYFADSVRRRLSVGQNIENVIRDLSGSFEVRDSLGKTQYILDGESFFINELLKLESTYSDVIPSNMFVTAKGSKKYSLMLPNMFNVVGNALRSAGSRAEIASKIHLSYLTDPENYYMNNSLVMKSLFGRDGVARMSGNFEFGDYNGIEFRVYDKQINKQSSDQTGREKLIANINSLLETGIIDVMRTGSSESFYFYKVNQWHHDYELKAGERIVSGTNFPVVKRVPFGSELYSEGKPNINFDRAFRGYFFNLLVDELSVMKLGEVPRSETFRDKIKSWGVFDKILSRELKDKLSSIEGDIRNGAYEYIDEFVQEVKDYFFDSKNPKNPRSRVNVFLKYAERFGITSTEDGRPGEFINDSIKSRYGASWRDLAANFILNTFVMNVEYSRIFTGVPQFYKDYHKRASGPMSPGNNANTGAIVLKKLRDTHVSTMAGAVGKPFNENIEVFNTNVLSDDYSSLDKEVEEKYIAAAKILGRSEEMEKIISEYNQTISRKKPVNDGQAWISLDFYRKFRIMVGNWDFQTDEVEYKKEVIRWKLRRGLYKTEEERSAAQKTLDKYPETLSTFPIAKLQYNGPQKHRGLMLPVFHKFAVMPLIPSAHEDTPLEDVMNWMVDNNLDYVTAESGSKNFTTDPLPLWTSGDRKEFAVSEQQIPNVLFSIYLKEQIKTQKAGKSESTWGSQIKSLWLSNRFNNGQSSAEVRKLFDFYQSGIEGLIEAEKEELFRKFGIVESGEEFRITNVKPLVTTLKKQAEITDLNSNIRESLSFDPVTGGFETPLEIITNRQSVMDMISGMIFRKLVRMQVNGDMLIQGSSTGTVKKGGKELRTYEPVIKKGKFLYTRAAQAKLAFNKNFAPLLRLIHPDGKRMSTRERLNEALRDGKWVNDHKKEITIVAYRFPTEGPHSMEFYEIEEFLPEVFGPNIITPREIVIKAGSDFDHDKLNIFRPSYGTDGKVLGEEAKREYERALEKVVDIRNREYAISSLIDEIFGEVPEEEGEIDIDTVPMSQEDRNAIAAYRIAKRNLKGYYTNKAIDSYIESLSSPEMFFSLIRPNTTDEVRELALKMANLAGIEGFSKSGVEAFVNTEIFDYTNNHIKFLQNVQGKNDLAVYAVLNKVLHNLQISGVALNPEFRNILPPGIYKGFETRLKVTPHLLSKEERDSFMVDGKLPLGYVNNINGKPTSEIIAELMNATVDIEKDAFYTGLGVNRYNKGVVAVLLLMRVPLERISAFLMQPILKEYYSRMESDPYYKADFVENSPAVPATNVHARNMFGLKNRRKLEEQIESLQNSEHDKIFELDRLLRNVNDKDWAKRDQYPIFAHFLALQRIQKMYMKIQGMITTDTKKISSPIGARIFEGNIQDLRDSGILDEENIRKLMERTFTSPFRMNDVVRKVFSTIMPVGFSETFTNSVINKIKSSDLFLTKDQVLKLERTFANDYMMYIILEHGEYGGKKLREYVAFQLSKKINKETLMNRLVSLQKKHPLLFRTFSLASKLSTNQSRKNPNIQNVELLRGFDNSTEMQEVMISEFKKLLNFRGNEVAGEVYSEEDVRNIRQFFRDLAITAFGQSGFNKSLLYMTDILPIEEIHPVTKRALQEYKKEILRDPNYEQQLLNSFVEDFAKENPSFGLKKIGVATNAEPYRGKYLNRPVTIPKPQGPQRRFIRSSEIITREQIQSDLGTLYLFGDNLLRQGLKGQAEAMRGEPNAVGIATKRKPSADTKAFFSDNTLEENKKIITADINNALQRFINGAYSQMVVPSLGTGLAQLDKKAPLTFQFLQEELARLEIAVNGGQLPEIEGPVRSAGIRIPMNFQDGDGGRRMREEFRGKSTMDLVLAGYRTATSRDVTKSYNQYNLKVGDIVEFYDKSGRTARVIITKASYPITEISREEWSKLEGWDESLYDELLKRPGKYEQFQYKLYSEIQPSTRGREVLLGLVKRDSKKEETPKTGPVAYVNHSGGAQGSDFDGWDMIGREYANIKNIHYYMGQKTPHGNTPITKEDEVEGQKKVTVAARQMGRIEPTFQVRDTKLIRNWAQVKYADAVFAITTLLNVGDPMNYGKKAKIIQGKGGTGYAIQMAINEGKPVYVFDQIRNQWYSNINGVWSRIGTPKLTPNFAGIGTREINEAGKQAIRDVYKLTFSEPKPKEEKPKTEEKLEKPKEPKTEFTLENFLKEVPYFFENLDDNKKYSDAEIADIIENSRLKTRVTIENYAKAKKLDNKYGEIIYDSRDRLADIESDFDTWREQKEEELEAKEKSTYAQGSLKFKDDSGEYIGLLGFNPGQIVFLENKDKSLVKYRVLEVYEEDETEDYPITKLVLQSKSGLMVNANIEFDTEDRELTVYFDVDDEVDDILNEKDQGC